ncbi:MAG: hypothetical protein JWN86_1661 [Planctomycetota bacterium]|nr:hypothetical protein [Planctomycetota bacterium]
MDVERSHDPPDPEFVSQRPGLLSGGLGTEPEVYLRVVANPFLGFLYLVVWLVALYHSSFGEFAGPLTPMLLVMMTASLALLPNFMQFHCLDCGGTGRFLRWRKHVCQRAMERRDSGRPRRFRGPSPPLQVVLWLWALVAFAMMLNALGLIASSP